MSVSEPTTAKCELTAQLSTRSFSSVGGVGSIAISAGRECAWAAETEAAWVRIDGATNGQGEAQISFRVGENPTPSARVGGLTIGGVRLDVAQEAAPCRFTLDRADISAPANGGAAVVRTSTMAGCRWTAQARDGWITIVGPGEGTGSGTATLSIANNPGAARQGTAIVAGHGVTVRQAAAGDPPPQSPAPPPQTPAPPPTPGPEPPPAPAPVPIELRGLAGNPVGVCPKLTVSLNGYSVEINRSTDFRGGNCRHLASGQRIEVRGLRMADGRVVAERVTIEERD